MNIKQQTFITEYLRHRSAFTAYCLAYNLKDCSNYDSIMSSANRLLNQPEVNSVITSVLDGIRYEVEQEIRAEMKTDVLSTQRKRELLAKIATGETYAVQNYKGKDCNMCVQHVWPSINQMLKAIDLDNKMVGLYSVYNRQSTSPQLAVEQLTKNNTSPEAFRENTTIHNNPAVAGQPSMRPKKIIMNGINNPAEPQSRESFNPEKILVTHYCVDDSDKKDTESQQYTTNPGIKDNYTLPYVEDRGTFEQCNPKEKTLKLATTSEPSMRPINIIENELIPNKIVPYYSI